MLAMLLAGVVALLVGFSTIGWLLIGVAIFLIILVERG